MSASGFGAVDKVSKGGDTVSGQLALTNANPFSVSGAVDGQSFISDSSGNFAADYSGWTAYNVKQRRFGAKGDCSSVVDGAMTNGSATLSSATANFTNKDVGKTVYVHGAGSISPPPAPALAHANTGGTVAAGVYQVIVTYVNAHGESLGSVSTSITTTGSASTITISAPPAWQNATAWYGYVTQVNGSAYTRQQSPGSPTALGINLTITAPPTNTGAAPPGSNTATGAILITTIAGYVSSTSVTLTASATTTVSPARVVYGTDDTAAIQAAMNYATGALTGGDLVIPSSNGAYLCGALTMPPGLKLRFEKNATLMATADMKASWLLATPHVVYDNTSVIGGTFDATECTSALVTALVDFGGTTTCGQVEIRNNHFINAPVHVTQMGEFSPSLNYKYISGNYVQEHGTCFTGGFGIYCDYVGNVIIENNYVYTASTYDNIELGHSGPQNLGGVNAHMICKNNIVVGGQLQFPFSHYAEIVGNTVINNTIQNDGNTADYVRIIGNKVINAAPVSTWAGISHWGAYGQIMDNHVQVTQGNGIGGSWNNEQVCNNYIITSVTPQAGYGIYPSSTGGYNTISGNIIEGAFAYGIYAASTFSAIIGNIINTFNGIQFAGVQWQSVVGNALQVSNIGLIGTPGANVQIEDNGGAPTGKYYNVTAVSTTYTTQSTDGVVLVSGTTTVTLLSAVVCPGYSITIKNTDATNTVTVATTASQHIDAATTYSLTAGHAVTLISDGTQWRITSLF